MRFGFVCVLLAVFVAGATPGRGALIEDDGPERPPPDPPWRIPRYPILAMRPSSDPPVVDGRIDADGEWGDACVLSGFFQKDLNGIAPPQAQVRVFLKTGSDALYVGMRSPVFPAGTTLRAFEKRHDALEGIMSGDHMVVELLPGKVRSEKIVRSTGFFALVWNTLGTLADLHVAYRPGMLGEEWISGATVANSVSEEAWEAEIRIPYEPLRNEGMRKYVALPPETGDYWSLYLARRFGKSGSNLFTTWVNDEVTLLKPYTEQVAAWSDRGMLRFDENAVAVRVHEFGDLTQNRVNLRLALYNGDADPHRVEVEACVQDPDGNKVWERAETVDVPPGKRVAVPDMAAELELKYPRGNLLYVRVMQDEDTLLYITPGLSLLCFDTSLREQYNRSLEVLRRP